MNEKNELEVGDLIIITQSSQNLYSDGKIYIGICVINGNNDNARSKEFMFLKKRFVKAQHGPSISNIDYWDHKIQKVKK